MTAKTRYVKAVCPHCQTEQVVDIQKLCRESVTVLGTQSRIKVDCVNKECPRKVFVIKVDCSEYR